MPYAFAHPAAAIAAHRLLGRHAVASALVAGSLVPDLWYAIPGLDRPHTHFAAALLWFCLPAGLVAYFAWHHVLKQPLAALLPMYAHSRLEPFLSPGPPRSTWLAVLASLLIGSATHLAWDALTHEGVLYRTFTFLDARVALGGLELRLQQLLQHGSTLGGTAFLVWWCHRWLRRTEPRTIQPVVSTTRKLAILLLVLAVAAITFAVRWNGAEPGTLEELRPLVKSGALASAGAASVALLAYCVAWRLARR